MEKEKKVEIKIEDLDKDLVKEVILNSIEQNEKQMVVFLLDKEINGENEQKIKNIENISAYIERLKLLLVKYSQ